MKKILSGVCAWIILFSCALFAEEKKPSWTDKLKFKGDYRYRHELIDEEGKKDRNRHRIRTRLGLEASVSETVNFTFQLATGAGEPVSTNQTLGTGFSGKGIFVDLSYMDWHPRSMEKLNVLFGKMKNPFYAPGKTELIWDHDLNPEGIALKYSKGAKSPDLFLNLASLWAEERGNEGDSLINGGQGGIKYKCQISKSKCQMTVGVSFFDYTSLKGKGTLFDAANSFGNSVNAAKKYAFDFNELEVFAEFGWKMKGKPVSLFWDSVTNSDPATNNKAWLAGFSVGEIKDPGTWAFRYNYREVEKDAVVGIHSDSDFIGGGTNGKGSEVGSDYQVSKVSQAGVTYFINEKGLTGGKDFKRFQLDVNFKF